MHGQHVHCKTCIIFLYVDFRELIDQMIYIQNIKLVSKCWEICRFCGELLTCNSFYPDCVVWRSKGNAICSGHCRREQKLCFWTVVLFTYIYGESRDSQSKGCPATRACCGRGTAEYDHVVHVVANRTDQLLGHELPLQVALKKTNKLDDHDAVVHWLATKLGQKRDFKLYWVLSSERRWCISHLLRQ